MVFCTRDGGDGVDPVAGRIRRGASLSAAHPGGERVLTGMNDITTGPVVPGGMNDITSDPIVPDGLRPADPRQSSAAASMAAASGAAASTAVPLDNAFLH